MAKARRATVADAPPVASGWRNRIAGYGEEAPGVLLANPRNWRIHPKAQQDMARPIRNHEGDVYDPFMGTGPTLVACEQLGRRGYGMEIEPKYVAVSLERLAGMGLTPKLEA